MVDNQPNEKIISPLVFSAINNFSELWLKVISGTLVMEAESSPQNMLIKMSFWVGGGPY